MNGQIVLICIFLINIQVLPPVMHTANLGGGYLQYDEMSKGTVIEELVLPKDIVFMYEITKE